MKIELITQTEQLLRSREAWNEIAGDRPFFRFEWLVNWLVSGIEPVTPAVLVGLDEKENWIGIAPFCIDSGNLMRKLRFCGSGNVCSDYLGLITKPGLDREFAESITDWLAEQVRPGGRLGRIDAIELEGVDLADENIEYWFGLMSASGFKSHSVPLEGCWAVDLPETWEELNRSLSKSMRRKTKKAVKHLALPETTTVSSDDQEWDAIWPTFVELHQQRRVMLGQAGCFADQRFEAFLKQSMKELLAAGLAELLHIYHEQKPLSSFLLINDRSRVMMYQSGMDTTRLALEPGYQMAVLGLQRSIEKGFRSFDFLRGDEPYKSRWQTRRIPLTRTRFIPRQFSSQLKHSIWETGRSVKQLLQSRAK